MHIALVIRDLIGGGAERSVLWLARGLIDRGHRIDIVLLRARVHYTKEVPQDARLFVVDQRTDDLTEESAAPLLERMVRLHEPSRRLAWTHIAGAVNWNLRCVPSRRLVRWTRGVVSYLEIESPDCILPNLAGAEAATLLACRFAARPPPIVPTIRVVVRHDRSWRLRLFMRRHLFSGAAHFVGVSQGVSDSVVATMGVARHKITTIYNPVVTPHLQGKMRIVPNHSWFFDGGAPVILSAGRLTDQKDFSTLIRAFALVTARHPCRLIILGEGEERGRLERTVKGLGLTDRVSLPGWVENPFAFMARASLFVVSSSSEGFSRVLVEALACGCPCVSTDCPVGPAEILGDGEFGPLVPVGDESALAAKMYRILERPPDRDVLRERAAQFSVDRAAAEYEGLISEFVTPSGGWAPGCSGRDGKKKGRDG